jgi:hypothetical protein
MCLSIIRRRAVAILIVGGIIAFVLHALAISVVQPQPFLVTVAADAVLMLAVFLAAIAALAALVAIWPELWLWLRTVGDDGRKATVYEMRQPRRRTR